MRFEDAGHGENVANVVVDDQRTPRPEENGWRVECNCSIRCRRYEVLIRIHRAMQEEADLIDEAFHGADIFDDAALREPPA